MKDQLLTVVDALLQAKAELNAHHSRRVKNAPRTLKRVEAILFDPKVDKAMGILVPGARAPSLVPADHAHQNEDA
jgi:hypothetical protein